MDATRVRRILEPALSSLDVDVEEVDVVGAGRRRRVCVVIDRDGGVDLDTIADVSRTVSQALDDSDVLGDAPYVLEVTSPGVDRPLELPRHWRRAHGRLVSCTMRDGTTLLGRVGESDDTSVRLETEEGPSTATFADIARARVQVEFRRPDSEGE